MKSLIDTNIHEVRVVRDDVLQAVLFFFCIENNHQVCSVFINVHRLLSWKHDPEEGMQFSAAAVSTPVCNCILQDTPQCFLFSLHKRTFYALREGLGSQQAQC